MTPLVIFGSFVCVTKNVIGLCSFFEFFFSSFVPGIFIRMILESLRKQLADTQAQLEKEKKEYMFLMADFDNFRKRTLKEKSELIKNGGENAMRGLLPIIDDFERSL